MYSAVLMNVIHFQNYPDKFFKCLFCKSLIYLGIKQKPLLVFPRQVSELLVNKEVLDPNRLGFETSFEK